MSTISRDRTIEKTGISIIDKIRADYPTESSVVKVAINKLTTIGDMVRFVDAYATYLRQEKHTEGLSENLAIGEIRNALGQTYLSRESGLASLSNHTLKWLIVLNDLKRSEFTKQ